MDDRQNSQPPDRLRSTLCPRPSVVCRAARCPYITPAYHVHHQDIRRPVGDSVVVARAVQGRVVIQVPLVARFRPQALPRLSLLACVWGARRAPAPTRGQGRGRVTTPYPSTTLTQRLPSVSGAARHLASRRPATRAGPAAERAQRISADGADQRPRVIALRHGDGATVDVEENDWARSARRA